METSVDHRERHEVAHRGEVEGEEVDLKRKRSPFRWPTASQAAVGSTMALSVRSLDRQTPMLPPLILYKNVLAALKETCAMRFTPRISYIIPYNPI